MSRDLRAMLYDAAVHAHNAQREVHDLLGLVADEKNGHPGTFMSCTAPACVDRRRAWEEAGPPPPSPRDLPHPYDPKPCMDCDELSYIHRNDGSHNRCSICGMEDDDVREGDHNG